LKQTEAETIATRKYHATHREKRRLYSAQWRKDHPEWRRAFRDRLDKLKSAPCMDCGNSFPPECMDFDHARGEKAFGIGPNRGMRIERLMVEVAKCDLVCSNCHRIRTKERNQYKKGK
jgi:hypothetical protein